MVKAGLLETQFLWPCHWHQRKIAETPDQKVAGYLFSVLLSNPSGSPFCKGYGTNR
jgi:hypothetical protein